MIECCGKERDTNFCGECGKMLKGHNPLVGLLSHVIKNVKKCESDLIWRNKRVGTLGNEWKIQSAQTRLVKWKSWRDALVELMENAKRKENNEQA